MDINYQKADEDSSSSEESEDPWDSEDYGHVILITAVAVLATLVVVFFLRFLYRKLCRNSLSQSPQTVSSLSCPSRHVYPNERVRGPSSECYPSPHHNPVLRPCYDPMAIDYQYVTAHQTLQAVRRRDGDPHRMVTDRTEPIFDPVRELTARENDSGFPLSSPGLGSVYIPRSSSHNSYVSSLEGINQHLFIQYDASVRELFMPTERSIRKTVSNKLLVMIAHLVDHQGDHLILDNTGISLHIPPGAIKEGEKHMITLVLNWDLSDNPDMASHQALVSPVVYCGPHGLELHKPCTLSYKHCAYDAGDIQVLVSETEFTHQKQWAKLCDAREEMGKCVITQEECQIKLDHFSLLTSIQSRPASSPGKKWLQIAVFTCPLQADLDHYQVRIYFLNKTPCALEWAIQNEAQFGGTKCCPEKVFLFNGSGEDMFLSMAYLSDRWASIDGTDAQRIPFLHIWHGHCPHVSMCFKRNSSAEGRTEEINIHFLAYQDGRDNEHERLVVHMTEDHSSRRQNRQSCCNNPSHGIRSVRITLPEMNPLAPSSSTVEISRGSPPGEAVDVAIGSTASQVNLDKVKASMSGREIFPEELKQKLMILLDPPAPLGNDWRALASKLSLDQVIHFLESIKASPTMVLLQHMEQKGGCLVKLLQILEEIGRIDASQHVSKLIGRTGTEHHDSTMPRDTESERIT